MKYYMMVIYCFQCDHYKSPDPMGMTNGCWVRATPVIDPETGDVVECAGYHSSYLERVERHKQMIREVLQRVSAGGDFDEAVDQIYRWFQTRSIDNFI